MGNLTVKDGPFTVTAQCFECGADASGMCVGGLGLAPFDAGLRIRVGSITETFRFHCAEHGETVQQVMCSEFGSCGNFWRPHPLVAIAAVPAPVEARLIYVHGCDDSTKVVMDLTDDEFATVAKVAEAVTAAAGSGCAPQMFLATDGEPSDLDYAWPECSTCYRNGESCECEGGPSA